MRIVPVLLAVLVSLLQPAAIAAQVLTGSLSGTVRDEQGGLIAGAQVRVSSLSLIGGTESATTDARGQFRFPALTPGSYVLDINAPRFVPYQVIDIRIGLGVAFDASAVLTRQSLTDTVTVVGSHTDTRDPGFRTSLGTDTIGVIPTRRNNFFDFINMAPGVSPTSQATSFVSVFGGGVDQNVFLADGTNITSTSNGVARTEPGIDFIQEIQILSVGASAEFGNAQGAVINILTRQGSNRFLSDVSYYWQPRGLTSQPKRLPINVTGALDSGYERSRYHDATTTLGGPVVRDRLWFFAGYQYLRDEASQPGGDPDYPREFQQDKAFGKLTWRLAPDWQLMQSLHRESWDNRELPTATKLVDATQRLRATVPAVTFGHLTHTSSANSLWDVRVGKFVWSQDISRATGDSSVPGRVDRKTGILSGAPPSVGGLKQIRWTATATFSYYKRLLGADHELKIGGQFDRAEHQAHTGVPTFVRFEDNLTGPVQTRAFLSGPSHSGGRVLASSMFATDSLRIGPRVTITAGIRFDHSRGISPAVPRFDTEGRNTGETISGAGLQYTWNELSPRLGFALGLTGDGRTMLRASYGLFTQGMLTGELSSAHPGGTTTTSWDVDPVTGDFLNPVPITPAQTQLDPHTRAPRTDAYSIGVDREIGGRLSVGAVYVHKDGRDFIAWEDIGGEYRKESRTVNGGTLPVNGVIIPVFVLTNSPAARLYNLTNPAEYSLTYNGVAFVVEKRRSHGWQGFVSYTYSRASGLQPSSGTTAAGAQVATTGAPPVSFAPPVTFGRDRNTLTNAGGRLPNDRPHLLRITGAFDVPRTGLTVAANLQYSSGKPWARTADIDLRQGNVRVLLEPRGSQRLSSQTVLDLRVSRAFVIAGSARLDLRLELLNALSDTAEESIANDRYDSPVLGNIFLDPRRVMLSVKLNLGK